MRLLSLSLATVSLLVISGASHAEAVLSCRIDQGGNTHVVEARAVSDPYSVKAVDINGRFRFKAVMVADEARIAYVKVYVYSQTRRQPVLLQEAKYLYPAMSASLTGIQYVYSNQLERELQYSCALLERLVEKAP